MKIPARFNLFLALAGPFVVVAFQTPQWITTKKNPARLNMAASVTVFDSTLFSLQENFAKDKHLTKLDALETMPLPPLAVPTELIASIRIDIEHELKGQFQFKGPIQQQQGKTERSKQDASFLEQQQFQRWAFDSITGFLKSKQVKEAHANTFQMVKDTLESQELKYMIQKTAADAQHMSFKAIQDTAADIQRSLTKPRRQAKEVLGKKKRALELFLYKCGGILQTFFSGCGGMARSAYLATKWVFTKLAISTRDVTKAALLTTQMAVLTIIRVIRDHAKVVISYPRQSLNSIRAKINSIIEEEECPPLPKKEKKNHANWSMLEWQTQTFLKFSKQE